MVILYILLVFVVVLLARTLMFTPKAEEQKVFEPIEQDAEDYWLAAKSYFGGIEPEEDETEKI